MLHNLDNKTTQNDWFGQTLLDVNAMSHMVYLIRDMYARSKGECRSRALSSPTVCVIVKVTNLLTHPPTYSFRTKTIDHALFL